MLLLREGEGEDRRGRGASCGRLWGGGGETRRRDGRSRRSRGMPWRGIYSAGAGGVLVCSRLRGFGFRVALRLCFRRAKRHRISWPWDTYIYLHAIPIRWWPSSLSTKYPHPPYILYRVSVTCWLLVAGDHDGRLRHLGGWLTDGLTGKLPLHLNILLSRHLQTLQRHLAHPTAASGPRLRLCFRDAKR